MTFCRAYASIEIFAALVSRPVNLAGQLVPKGLIY